MLKIEAIKEYQMMASKIPVGTILSETTCDGLGMTFKDQNGKLYVFEASEVIFSSDFKESFRKIE